MAFIHGIDQFHPCNVNVAVSRQPFAAAIRSLRSDPLESLGCEAFLLSSNCLAGLIDRMRAKIGADGVRCAGFARHFVFGAGMTPKSTYVEGLKCHFNVVLFALRDLLVSWPALKHGAQRSSAHSRPPL